jgi:hypothetical protein
VIIDLPWNETISRSTRRTKPPTTLVDAPEEEAYPTTVVNARAEEVHTHEQRKLTVAASST